jgi:hypothetical protein
MLICAGRLARYHITKIENEELPWMFVPPKGTAFGGARGRTDMPKIVD